MGHIDLSELLRDDCALKVHATVWVWLAMGLSSKAGALHQGLRQGGSGRRPKGPTARRRPLTSLTSPCTTPMPCR